MTEQDYGANQSFDFVRAQHENLRQLILSCLESDDPVFRTQVFVELAKALTVHNAIEHEVFFPFMAYHYGDEAVEEAEVKNDDFVKAFGELRNSLGDEARAMEGFEDLQAILKRHIYLVETQMLTPSDGREPDFLNDVIEIVNMMKRRARQLDASHESAAVVVDEDQRLRKAELRGHHHSQTGDIVSSEENEPLPYVSPEQVNRREADPGLWP